VVSIERRRGLATAFLIEQAAVPAGDAVVVLALIG